MSIACAPVVVFAYNRPDHLQQTLTALANAKLAGESDVWVFSDGPKSTNSRYDVEAVRALLDQPAWRKCFASFSLAKSKQNKGLAASIIGGVTKVLENHDRVIVLEDDLVVSCDFLSFMNDSLSFFRGQSNIGSVTGFCPLSTIPQGYEHDVMAVPRNCSHGWGTWADLWRTVDWTASGAKKVRRNRRLRRAFNSAGSDRLNRLRHQLAGDIDSWSIRFGLWQVLTGRHTIYPTHNRVKNIGMDGSGVHTGPGDEKNENIAEDFTPYNLISPEISQDILKAFQKAYSGPLHSRFLRSLRNI